MFTSGHTVRNRTMRTALKIVLAAAVAVWIAVLFRRPSNDREWAADQRLLPQAVVTGDFVEIRNVRNFTYRAQYDYTPRYETRTYDLRQLDSVWFMVER